MQMPAYRILSCAVALTCAVAWGRPANADPVLFVANWNGPLAEYNLDGTTVNASLNSNMFDPQDMAVSGSNLFVTEDGTVAEYTTSGATVNASLIPGLNYYGAGGIAISGSDIFVGRSSSLIAEYTTSGATVNASLIPGLTYPSGIAVSGTNLFITSGNNTDTGEVLGEYTTSGGTVNASLVPNLGETSFIVVSDSDIFVPNYFAGTIAEYTTSGTLVNASLISGLDYPTHLAISGSDIFVLNTGNGTIGEYTTAGATLNAELITGLRTGGGAIAIADVSASESVSEPASSAALLVVALGLTGLVHARRRVLGPHSSV